nr:hypothetical protein [uncultured Psychroserpens sp.]
MQWSNQGERRIIYELEEKHSNHIINYFEAAHKNSDKNKYNLRKQFVEINGLKESFNITFNTCDEYYKNEKFIKITNRFLKLSDFYLIPIVPSEDAEFSIKAKDKTLQTWVGSKGISFIVDENGSIQKLSIM